MFELEGRYNKAVIMLADKVLLDQGTEEQVIRFLNNRFFADTSIVIMPDCHVGYGACIGFTMTMNEYVIPNIVGVDLSCGVLAVNIGRTDIRLPLLDEWIHENIAHGFAVNKEIQNTAKEMREFYRQVEEISQRINSSAERNRLAVGSLGGGNHFIEVGVDKADNKWLTVHCGSRKFGLDIASYYQNMAKRECGRDCPGDLAGLRCNLEGAAYLHDIRCAAEFASINRATIVQKIVRFLNADITDRVESVHNYIGEDNMIRKGAVSAYKNERLVIPFNMEDGLIIGRGRGNKEWNNSAPHGAGRVLSRKQAFKQLKLSEAVAGMKNAGIYTTSMHKGTLDEAKAAYKDKKLILEAIRDNVEITEFVRPVYNFKADESR